MDKRICYVFASRSRPEKFFNCLNNIQDNSNSENYFVIAKLDDDDASMNNDDVKERLKEYPEVEVKWGASDNKIHAINRGLENLPQCDIIIVQSDDMVFEVFGFDDEIRESFEKHFPNLDGVVHYPEINSGERTMVLTIMGINLYKQLGYLYHPSFLSVYADNHLTEMTKAMNKYVFVNKKIYSHQHPIYKMTEWDEQYRRTESQEFYQKDHATFLRLKADNFGL